MHSCLGSLYSNQRDDLYLGTSFTSFNLTPCKKKNTACISLSLHQQVIFASIKKNKLTLKTKSKDGWSNVTFVLWITLNGNSKSMAIKSSLWTIVQKIKNKSNLSSKQHNLTILTKYFHLSKFLTIRAIQVFPAFFFFDELLNELDSIDW